MDDPERRYPCTVAGCDKSYTRSDHLARHSLSHTGERKYQCDECGKKFAVSHHLKRHQQLHDRPKPHPCPIDGCSLAFQKKSQLRRHLCTHTNTLPYPCPDCDWQFDYPSQLKKHIASAHTPDEEKVKKFICGEKGCGEAFLNQRKLQAHGRLHHTPDHVCPKCSKCFKHLSDWKRHLDTHSADRKLWVCNLEGCTKAYTMKGNLKQHVKRFHEGIIIDRKYDCPEMECGKSFWHKNLLFKHLAKEHGLMTEKQEAGCQEEGKQSPIAQVEEREGEGTIQDVEPPAKRRKVKDYMVELGMVRTSSLLVKENGFLS